MAFNKSLLCVSLSVLCIFGGVSSVDALSIKDTEALYKAVEAETREVSTYEEKLNVANVILNRVNNPSFPNTPYGVIHAHHTNARGHVIYQFSVVSDGSYKKAVPSDVTIKAVDDAIGGKWNMSDKVVFFNIKGLNCWAKRNKKCWGTDSIHEFYYQ